MYIMWMVVLTLWEYLFMKNEIDKSIAQIKELKNFSVGNDLVYLPDFKLSFNNLFKKKVYTSKEIEYCDQFDQPILRYASTWAAKEAIYKGIKQLQNCSISFKKIEILRVKAGGQPVVNLPETIVNKNVALSITHDGDYVWAIAIFKEEAS